MTTEFNSNMIVLGENKQKGDGVNAVLNFMKEVRDFQEKIDACAEAQINPTSKATIEKFSDYVEDMYANLLDMAKGGIRKIRRPDEVQEAPEVVVEKGTSVNSPVRPTM